MTTTTPTFKKPTQEEMEKIRHRQKMRKITQRTKYLEKRSKKFYF